MNAKRATTLAFAVGLLIGVLVASTGADEHQALKLETVLRADLESASGLEVIVSVIDIPPATTLPKHHHPGEEFVYVLEGSAALMLEGEDDIETSEGSAVKVPLEKIHTAKTGDEPMRAVVFRVHKKGEPERILVE